MRQHQQFCFGIRCRPHRIAAQPRVPDFAHIRSRQPVPRMPLRPRPPIDVEEPRRPHHHAIRQPHRGKRHHRARIAPCQRRRHIVRSLLPPLRNRAPAIQLWINSRSRRQPINVLVRFSGSKLNTRARQKYRRFKPSYLLVYTEANAICALPKHSPARSFPGASPARSVYADSLSRHPCVPAETLAQPTRFVSY